MPGFLRKAEAGEMIKPIKEEGYFPLPDVTGWKYLGEFEQDNSKIAPGKEIIRGYQKDNVQLLMVFFRGKKRPYAYWYYNVKTKKGYDARLDADNDGNFEYHLPNAGDFGKISGMAKYWGYK